MLAVIAATASTWTTDTQAEGLYGLKQYADQVKPFRRQEGVS
jgi:hypothetical protein